MENQKTLIVGMGKTGYSFADYLLARGMEFDFADTREQPESLLDFQKKYMSAQFYLGELDKSILPNYHQLLLSPGFDSRHGFIKEARKQKIHIKSDIDLFVSNIEAKIVGITGSNGKTTLTEMVGYGLQQLHYKSAVGGNIGMAALSLLKEKRKDIYVLELSSFQLDISHNLPLDVAVVLNVTEDHLDRYDSFADYANSKASIYKKAKTKIVNLDDAVCKAMLVEREGVKTFSLYEKNADYYYSIDEAVFYANGKSIINAQELLLQGEHNYQNILAALAIAEAMQINVQDFSEAIKSFAGLPHRCEWVVNKNQVGWVNDSKATNVGATIAAMNSMKKPIHIIMGGQAKGVDFTDFANSIPEHVKSIILLGEDAEYISTFIQDRISVELVETMLQAVELARKISVKGDTVLLSPACASFDMYAGYEQRGEHFKKLVMELVA